MATLQVKNLDDDLYRALGARAAMDNRSISQEVVTMIQESLALRHPRPQEATKAFLELAGSWIDGKSAQEIARSIRKARRKGRRSAGGRDVFA